MVIQLIVLLGLYLYKVDNKFLYAGIVVFMVSLIKIKIILSENFIEYSIFPFFKKTIQYKQIKLLKISELNAMSDFLGWGIRYSKKLGWGYIFFTENAMYLETENKKNVISIKNKQIVLDFLNNHKDLENLGSDTFCYKK